MSIAQAQGIITRGQPSGRPHLGVASTLLTVAFRRRRATCHLPLPSTSCSCHCLLPHLLAIFDHLSGALAYRLWLHSLINVVIDALPNSNSNNDSSPPPALPFFPLRQPIDRSMDEGCHNAIEMGRGNCVAHNDIGQTITSIIGVI